MYTWQDATADMPRKERPRNGSIISFIKFDEPSARRRRSSAQFRHAVAPLQLLLTFSATPRVSISTIITNHDNAEQLCDDGIVARRLRTRRRNSATGGRFLFLGPEQPRIASLLQHVSLSVLVSESVPGVSPLPPRGSTAGTTVASFAGVVASSSFVAVEKHRRSLSNEYPC